MSASTEKKNRRAAREAGTDKKTLAAQAEAKKQAQSKRRWTIGTIAVILLIVAVLLLNTSLPYTATTAVTVAGQNYSPAQVSYYYGNAFYTWANQYGSYASLFGLDTSSGIRGLDSQDCPMLDGGTWRDYFLESAELQLAQTQAMLDYAAENGIALTEDEIAEVDASLADTEAYAQLLGYSSFANFLSSNYGRGISAKMAREFSLNAALSTKVLTQVQDSLEYSAQELEDYYQSLEGSNDMFDFMYYYVAAETVETAGEDGETVNQATDETKAAAKETVDAIMDAYEKLAANAGGYADYVEFFDSAVAEVVDGATAIHPTNYTGSALGAYSDFLMGDRQMGDADVVENTSAAGYYAVVFLSRNDNHYPMAQVRHILVMAEADADGTYSDEAKAAAQARAAEILAEWKAGEATEESFAALAEQYSEDGGSNTNGGLYDTVYQGQMVPEFDAFCFEGHKPGDTAIVYGESGSYAGYHVMYYVGEGEQYSDYIARKALSNEDLQAWLEETTAGYEATERYALRFVG